MPALVERPKMSMAMWAALKTHIMRQREKKKQEQEADAATERVRREQELKRRQDAMTLEEIRDQVQQSEKKLVTLKEEKHQLFMQLKKVLHEDDTRKRALVKEANEMAALNHSYLQQQHHNAMQQHAAAAAAAAAANAPQHLYIQEMNRAHSMYKLAQPIPQNPGVLHRAPLKRPLTPSPPPQSAQASSSSSQQQTPPQSGFSPQQPYAYKAQIPSSAYGAPKLIPAYAPGHGPIYYVPGQGSVPAMAPAAPVPYPAYPTPQFPHHHAESAAAAAAAAAAVAKQQQMVATHNFHLAQQQQQVRATAAAAGGRRCSGSSATAAAPPAASGGGGGRCCWIPRGARGSASPGAFARPAEAALSPRGEVLRLAAVYASDEDSGVASGTVGCPGPGEPAAKAVVLFDASAAAPYCSGGRCCAETPGLSGSADTLLLRAALGLHWCATVP
ncbi:hypothetical protein HPB48_012985 [Haemaphysalis longicornis]|uniref:G protein pathway suppressor 2 n=1 Tax=Haemaphysalis longicornis TaxID=44386 RepID=A0A9J6FMM4_HAELO|nr:hypothetical protein HPB48_012985 [Haemaphysalis longicornis]